MIWGFENEKWKMKKLKEPRNPKWHVVLDTLFVIEVILFPVLLIAMIWMDDTDHGHLYSAQRDLVKPQL